METTLVRFAYSIPFPKQRVLKSWLWWLWMASHVCAIEHVWYSWICIALVNGENSAIKRRPVLRVLYECIVKVVTFLYPCFVICLLVFVESIGYCYSKAVGGVYVCDWEYLPHKHPQPIFARQYTPPPRHPISALHMYKPHMCNAYGNSIRARHRTTTATMSMTTAPTTPPKWKETHKTLLVVNRDSFFHCV